MDLNVQAILAAAKRLAKFRFRNYPNKAELVADVQSTAWELSLTAGPNATVNTLANFACRRVSIRRQFSESQRDLTAIPKDKRASRAMFRKVFFDIRAFIDSRNDPAEIAAFRIDCPAWLASLSPLKRQAAEMLAVGERTSEVARRLEVSPGRIAQIRRELAESWIAAHS